MTLILSDFANGLSNGLALFAKDMTISAAGALTNSRNWKFQENNSMPLMLFDGKQATGNPRAA